MVKVLLGDVAKERRESLKSDKTAMSIVGLEHLIPQQIQLTEWSEYTENTFTKVFYKGDILFGRRRAYLKKAALAPFDGICSGDITVIAPIENKITPELLPFIIQNDAFFDYAVEKSAGSLSPRVKWEHLKNYEFELPDLEEQKKLAKILWAAEETKQAYKKLLQKTDDLVKAKFEEVSHDIKNADCERKQWMDVVNITNGKDHKKISGDGPYAVYGTGGKMMAAKEYMCDKGTIIMGRKGTIDKPYIASEKCWIVDTAFGVNPKNPNILNPIYLYQYIKQIDYSKLNKACTLPSTTKSDLLKLWIDVPSTKVQNTFVQFAQQAEQSKQQLQTSLDSLNATMRALINENLK